MMRIHTEGAPAAIGPYSQAVACDGLLFSSGQIGLDPKTQSLVPGGVRAEAAQVMRNLDAVLRAGGSGLGQIVRATIFLADIADFAAVNEIYGGALGDHRPARSTVAVRALPKGASVEIDVIARLPR